MPGNQIVMYEDLAGHRRGRAARASGDQRHIRQKFGSCAKSCRKVNGKYGACMKTCLRTGASKKRRGKR